MKLLFIPVSVIAGLIAGFLGRKTFEQLWGVIDTEEPPQPTRRSPAVPGNVVSQATR